MPKTGSSAIQVTLSGNEHNRITHAKFGKQNHTVPQRSLFSRSKDRFYHENKLRAPRADITRTNAIYGKAFSRMQAGKADVILSADGVCDCHIGHIQPARLELLR